MPTPKDNLSPKSQTSINLTSFQKKFIAMLTVSIVVVLVAFIFINKEASKILSISESINKFRENQSDINNLMEYIAKMERQSKEVGNDHLKYQELLTDKRDLADVRKNINNIFLKKKLDPMFSFVTENSPKEKEPGSYGFSLVVTGQIDKILEAVQEIKNLKILISFDQVIINKVLPKSVAVPEIDNISRESPDATIPKVVIPKTDIYKVTINGKIYLKEPIIEAKNE